MSELVVFDLPLSPLGKRLTACRDPLRVVIDPTGRGTWRGSVQVASLERLIEIAHVVADSPEIAALELDRQVRAVAAALGEVSKIAVDDVGPVS